MAHDSEGWIPEDSFAGRLAILRITRGWHNVAKAARTCGFDDETWRGWERGRNPQDFPSVCRQIAEATGCSYAWLAGDPGFRTGRFRTLLASLFPSTPALNFAAI